MQLDLFVEFLLTFLRVSDNNMRGCTPALCDCLCEIIPLPEYSLPLALSPLIETNGESIHFSFEVIESKVDRRE